MTLDRLENKGFLTSWLSDPTPERGGRTKRHDQLEAAGRRALRTIMHRMADLIQRDLDSDR